MGLQATINVSTNADWIQAFNYVDSGVVAPTLQSGGNSYTSAPQVVCSAPVDQNGVLIPGGVPAQMHCTISGGAVNTLVLDKPGQGYLIGYPPSISFVSVDGNGSGAAAFTTVGNPISLSGANLWMEVRRTATDVQALITVGTQAPLTGITITNAAQGQFQIVLPRAGLALLTPGGSYVHDLLFLRTDGYYQRIWTGTLTVDGGVTR